MGRQHDGGGPDEGSGSISSSSRRGSGLLTLPPLRRAPSATVRSAHAVVAVILFVEVVILLYLKAALVPDPSSAITDFTSSSPGRSRTPVVAAADALAAEVVPKQQLRLEDTQQEDPEERRLQQLTAPLTIGACGLDGDRAFNKH